MKYKVKRGLLSIVMTLALIVSGFTGIQTYATSVDDVIPEDDYLTFTAEEADSSVTINCSNGTLQYNYGNGWQSYNKGTVIDLEKKGDYVRFYGTGVRFTRGYHVEIEGRVAASGDVCSLRLDSDGSFAGLSDGCFECMFYDCSGLTKAPKLSATTLADFCYTNMFYNCTSLKKAPELPATDLAESCYEQMFSGCRSLTELPALPATTLPEACYYYMFYNCKSIKLSEKKDTYYNAEYRIPASGEGTTADGALIYMFTGTGGKFRGTPEINKVYYIHKEVPPISLSETSLTIEKGDIIQLTATINPDIQDPKVRWEAICENDEIGLYSDEECSEELQPFYTDVLTVYVKGESITTLYDNVTVKASIIVDTIEYSDECSIGVSLVAPTYTVTIPAKIGMGGTAEVRVEELYNIEDNKLCVTIVGDAEGKFTVKQSDDTLTYTITAVKKVNNISEDTSSFEVKNNDTLLSVGDDTQAPREVSLTFNEPTQEPKYAGDYKGTVTFKLSIEPKE